MERMFKTSKESFDALKDIERKIRLAIEVPDDSFDTVEWLEKERREIIRNLIPEVGTKGTIIYYTDRRAVTVVEVNERGDRVGVKFNEVKCLDYFGNNYEILPELDESEDVEYFSRRKSGRWRNVGYPDRPGEVQLCIHFHEHYINPTM